jgi:hypothetical protein
VHPEGLRTELQNYAPLASPALTGAPTAPTATAGTNTTQLATTAFVQAAVSGGGTSAASETVAGIVELATATETTAGIDDTRAVHPAGLKVELDKKAPLASPALTGTPTAPTATTGTSSTQLATTAFVASQIAASAPAKTGTGATGTWGIAITGNAATATTATTATSAAKLTTPRTLSLSGDVSGSATFDGSANATLTTAVSDDSHSHTTATLSDVASGTYTPVIGTPANCTATVGSANFLWHRIGNVVSVYGKIIVTATTANTVFTLPISLPVARSSNFSNTTGAAGVGTDDHGHTTIRVQALGSTQTANLRGTSTVTAATEVGVTFSYSL